MQSQKTIFNSLIVATAVLANSATAATFDTETTAPATDNNYWPFGDAGNNRYQQWFSGSSLSGYAGSLSSITFFPELDLRAASWDVDISASTTAATPASLQTAPDMDANHGANKTLIFSGTVNYSGSGNLVIPLNSAFNFSGGNLLIDQIFSSFTGVGNFYDGPLFEAIPASADFVRVTDHADPIEGSVVFDESTIGGSLRTQLNFTTVTRAVPEGGSTIAMLGLVATATILGRRLRKEPAV